METENKLPQRKPLRLQNYNYNSNGSYFITFCTYKRKNTLVSNFAIDQSHILTRVAVNLSEPGKIAENVIVHFPNNFGVKIDCFVIMPNHIHILLHVSDDHGPSGLPVTTRQNSIVARFVSTFKRFCNKEYGENIWQRYYYDHIIRDREDYEKHIKYIYENPIRWYYDELYAEE